MLELTMYGLVGLAAMLVIAFYFAYRDESARPVPGSDAIPYSRSRGALLVIPGLPSDRQEEYQRLLLSGKYLLGFGNNGRPSEVFTYSWNKIIGKRK